MQDSFEQFELLRQRGLCQHHQIDFLVFYSPLPTRVVYAVSYDFAKSHFFLSLLLTPGKYDHLSSILFDIYYLLHLP